MFHTITMMNPLFRNIAWCGSILDYGFVLLRYFGPTEYKFFHHGFGNTQEYFDTFASTMKELDQGTYKHVLNGRDIRYETTRKHKNGIITTQDGYFLSPLANHLPKESAYCKFTLVRPINENNNKDDNRNDEASVYILMLPATGEMGKSERLEMATKLAQTHGWSSVIVTAPYYASRKPKDQNLFFLHTARDLLFQSQGIIEESSALARYLLAKSPQTRVCFTGFSYGAAMAACSSSLCLKAGDDGSRMSCAVYVGSASPCPFADGMLENGIDWDALEKDQREEQPITIREQLHGEFYKTQLKLVKADASNRLSAVFGYAMRNDLFIRPWYAKELQDQIRECLNDDYCMQWIPGGHMMAALMRPILHKNLIENTVQAMLSKKLK